MRAPAKAKTNAFRMGICAAWLTLLGILFSGPLAMLLLHELHPQPPWRDAELFARNFHVSQSLPYLAGFFLVGGYVMLIASLHALADDEQKPRTAAALSFTSAFAALVFLNYIVQTTTIPNLVKHYAPENDAIIAQLSMSNPASLSWAIEMWAWAFLGVATWLASAVFSSSGVERAASATFIANGVSSVLGALCTAARPDWVMTTAGLLGFAGWNVLVFGMSILVLVALKRRLREANGRSPVSMRFMRVHARHA